MEGAFERLFTMESPSTNGTGSSAVVSHPLTEKGLAGSSVTPGDATPIRRLSSGAGSLPLRALNSMGTDIYERPARRSSTVAIPPSRFVQGNGLEDLYGFQSNALLPSLSMREPSTQNFLLQHWASITDSLSGEDLLGPRLSGTKDLSYLDDPQLVGASRGLLQSYNEHQSVSEEFKREVDHYVQTLGIKSGLSTLNFGGNLATGVLKEAALNNAQGPPSEVHGGFEAKAQNLTFVNEEDIFKRAKEEEAKLSEEELKRIPKDENGNPTSIGSIGHPAGTCRPCAFNNNPKKAGCANGLACTYCHFAHPKQKRPHRPTKQQRQARAQQATLGNHLPVESGRDQASGGVSLAAVLRAFSPSVGDGFEAHATGSPPMPSVVPSSSYPVYPSEAQTIGQLLLDAAAQQAKPQAVGMGCQVLNPAGDSGGMASRWPGLAEGASNLRASSDLAAQPIMVGGQPLVVGGQPLTLAGLTKVIQEGSKAEDKAHIWRGVPFSGNQSQISPVSLALSGALEKANPSFGYMPEAMRPQYGSQRQIFPWPEAGYQLPPPPPPRKPWEGTRRIYSRAASQRRKQPV